MTDENNGPLTHEELSQARHAIDYRTGRPAIDNPVFKRDLFAAQVSRQAADEQAAAARPVPTPNEQALAEIARVQAWVNPLTGTRAYLATDALGQQMRETIEGYRQMAIEGHAIPPDVLADTRARMAAAQAEADAKVKAAEAAELERFRKQQRGY